MAAAQQERKAKLATGRVGTVFKMGDRVLLRAKGRLDAAEIGELCDHGAPEPQRRHTSVDDERLRAEERGRCPEKAA